MIEEYVVDNVRVQISMEDLMAKESGKKKRGSGSAKKVKNLPSKTGRPSGKQRGNAPSKDRK